MDDWDTGLLGWQKGGGCPIVRENTGKPREGEVGRPKAKPGGGKRIGGSGQADWLGKMPLGRCCRK
jgi:hypothetical protein